uniref:(California timema) hypothetical protein n=1 Tax=Timema californicum TaxID=61474 RepID=A0A7R9JF58_TIMCA|nr:unnamed protein product [Timema californicum]
MSQPNLVCFLSSKQARGPQNHEAQCHHTVYTTPKAAQQGNILIQLTNWSWQDEEDEEVDWSWVQDELRLISHREEEDARGQLAASTTTEAECPPSHRASWLRASMRRVSHFRLGEPPGRVCSAPPGPLPPLPPLGPPPPVHSSTRRPHTQHQDFPRRYSAGVVQHVTVSATNSPGRHSQSSAVSSASTESSVGVSSSDETSPRPAATRPPVTSR